MGTGEERWVPKVHPTLRELASEDPLELMAEPVSGDPEVMLECILQEFLWLGCNTEQLLGLFHNPEYPLLCDFRAHFGDEAVEQRVAALVDRWGVLQFRETIAEPDDEYPDDDYPGNEHNAESMMPLVQLTLPQRLGPDRDGI